MAKIPRIAQNNRPSSVLGEVSPAPERYLAKAAEAMGKMVDTGLGVATNEELAERKRLAEIMAAKQAIKDASDEGVVNLDAENYSLSRLGELEDQYRDRPELVVSEYRKTMEDYRKSLADREDINDQVKLGATKNLESVMSSGQKQAFSIYNRLSTEKIAANTMAQEIAFGNAAKKLSSPQAVEVLANRYRAERMAEYGAIYGKKAGQKIDEVVNKGFNAWLTEMSFYSPEGLIAMRNDPTLNKYAASEDIQRAVEKSYTSVNNMADRARVDRYVDSSRRGSVLARNLSAGTLQPEDIITEDNRITADERAILASNEPEAVKKQKLEAVKRDRADLTAIETVYRANLPPTNITDMELPTEIRQYRDKFFGSTKKKKKAGKLDMMDLLAYREKILTAAAQKTLPEWRTLLNEVTTAQMTAATRLSKNTSWFDWAGTYDEVAANQQEELFAAKKPKAPQIERDGVALIYAEKKYNTLSKRGEGAELTKEEARELARQAYFEYFGSAKPGAK